ncbi:MAG: 2'-5' RNA ligase family protein [Minisyncoccota bacterium]
MNESLAQNENIEPYRDLGVALNLEGALLDEAKNLANEIQKKAKCIFVLDGNAKPHITLFQGRFPADKVSDVDNVLKEVLASGELEDLNMDTKLFFRPNGNVFWNVLDSSQLKLLHERLNQVLIGKTQGLLMEQFQQIIDDPNFPETDKSQIKKYGALLAGEKFLPHVTLGRLANPEDKKLLKDIKVPPLSFHPEHFILGSLGSYGEIKTIISDY